VPFASSLSVKQIGGGIQSRTKAGLHLTETLLRLGLALGGQTNGLVGLIKFEATAAEFLTS